MTSRGRNGYVFFAVIALVCAPLTNDRERPVDAPHPGMKKILSAGRSFQQGWNSAVASYDEKPGMESGFTYDFWLDSTEVTQGQYYAVTGRRPAGSSSAYGVGDNYPVYYVTWFDAVLYCNVRSQLEGLDTVYRYSGVKALPNGKVYELTGLRYDVERDGYRLPTEAEWEYAAREGGSALAFTASSDSAYASYYAWYGKNSSNMTHPVGGRLPNTLGLYDMAGNVFEWTNDWKCMYTGQRITNSLGAFQPGYEFEKVIKGGSYNYSQMYLRQSHRSATYATMLSSANEYVGFRCARGILPNGEYIGLETSFKPNTVTIMMSAGDLCLFSGTSNAKLVFVNVTGSYRTLCYVDFSRMFPYVVEYLDDRNVYHPTLSPDGRYVAYCSRNEGQTGQSKVSFRSLDSLHTEIVQLSTDSAYIPRWRIQTGTDDTCIVYTNSGIDNGNPLWSRTQTFLQKVSGGNPAGAPQELIGNGSYHDGLSVNGRYGVSGYTRLKRRDLTTGLDTQLFVSPENGKDGSGSDQVCNVSMSPDTGDSVRCMFLDFGYPRTSTVVGRSYGVHEYLFVSDMSGRMTNFIQCPDGEQSWDGVEWTNQGRFAVGCGRNSADQAHAVYAIDLEGKSHKQLVTGVELHQPYLHASNILENDSLGRYNDPPTDIWHADWATHMLMFWRIFDALEIAVLGSSRAQMDVDPRKINGYKSFNLGAAAGDLLWQKHLIFDYILNHCPDIKLICTSLDMGWLNIPEGDFHWTAGFGQSKGYKYDSTNRFWKNGITADFKNLIQQVPLPIPWELSLLGHVPWQCYGWGENPPPRQGEVPIWTIADTIYQRNLATIAMISDTLRSRGIHWIMINFPVSPHYKGTEYYSHSGPSWQTARDILQQMGDIEASNSFFHLYDANMDGNHDYGDEDASDQDHLCGKGADKLTPRLARMIDSVLSR